jgi:DNA repair exonuclease SbcCD ATPase subunit
MDKKDGIKMPTVEELKEEIKAGTSIRKIALKYSMPKTTVHKMIKEISSGDASGTEKLSYNVLQNVRDNEKETMSECNEDFVSPSDILLKETVEVKNELPTVSAVLSPVVPDCSTCSCIADLSASVTAKENVIADLNKAIHDKDDIISGLQTAVSEKSATIEELNQKISSLEGSLKAKDNECVSFSAVKEDYEKRISSLTADLEKEKHNFQNLYNSGLNKLRERDAEILRLGKIYLEMSGRINFLEKEKSALVESAESEKASLLESYEKTIKKLKRKFGDAVIVAVSIGIVSVGVIAYFVVYPMVRRITG